MCYRLYSLHFANLCESNLIFVFMKYKANAERNERDNFFLLLFILKESKAIIVIGLGGL
jgi:hypothetical protein